MGRKTTDLLVSEERLLELFDAEEEVAISAGTPKCFTHPELFDPVNWPVGEVRGDPKVVAKVEQTTKPVEQSKKKIIETAKVD